MLLTAEQQAIIDLGFEHCVITAVAGSGKTTTLACRIHRLLQTGHAPERMLILMFNRSAKEDFERKLQSLCRLEHLKLPEIRTYHAMGYRLYQRFIRDGHLAPIHPKVLTEQEVHYQVWNLIRTLAPPDLQDEIKRNKKENVAIASNFIDQVKSTLATAMEVFTAIGASEKYRFLLDLFDAFEKWRKDYGRITFADMLYEPVKLISEKPELQTLVADKMDLILVDEYQDTNEIQHRLLKYIAGQRARVTVVGDPDQTIYEFRGARPEYILNRFAEEFESPKELTLSYTFRYGHRVALLANHLISHNKGRKDVLCHSHTSVSDTHIYLHQQDPSAAISDIIRKHQQRNKPLEDIAVLCRVWSQTVPIELTLLAQETDYQIDVGKGALASREVVALVYLLEFSAGRFADLSVESRRLRFHALLRFPHTGLNEDRINYISDLLARENAHWPLTLMEIAENNFNALQKKRLKTFAAALDLIALPQQSMRVLTSYIDQTGLYEGIRSLALTHESAEEKIGIVKGFLNYVRQLKLDVHGTLAHIDGLKDRVRRMDKSKGLLLTTIHRAKGLEWPTVIIPGLIEKFLPYTEREKEITQSIIESERRLLYVAMTRSIHELHLITAPLADNTTRAATYPNRHASSHSYVTPEQLDDNKPSRFVAELQHALSDSLGGFLYQPRPTESSDSAPGRRQFTADRRLTEIAKRYCDAENTDYTEPELPKIGRAAAIMADKNDCSEIWRTKRIRHAIFGPGSIVSETENAFKVTFDDARVMEFSKKSAHLYFSVE
ncbi:MAG: ATP-dependent helicase [Hahellaceae bacterium]|nr:ATP-dependent helicase [Hahellaceae bacterium]MCP5210438.1 ATP-dependent helicase [Hahellaceae bacterium]